MVATEKSAMFGLLVFILIYRPAEGCGWTTTNLTGTIESPNFPSNNSHYPNNQDCVYIIKAPDGYQVTLTFIDFNLEAATNCSSDYLEIRDGDESSQIIGRHCDTSLPGLQRSSANQMWIKFHTDGSVTRRGFRAVFRSVSECRWDTTDLAGTVQSPNFPENYSNHQDCIYTITAPVGYRVTLTFTDFILESHHSCSYDYLELRDGNETSPVIGRYCWSLPSPKRSSGNQMWIRFHSDGSVTRRGFRATFLSDPGCVWSTSNLTGTVQSLNFPNNYPDNQNCVYTIRAPSGYQVTLTFTDFDLEVEEECGYDYLEIRDGGQTSPILGRHCGASPPAPVRSSGSRMWIRFKTDSSVTKRGFKATFISVSGCGWATTGLSGTVQSPNFPRNYTNGQNCVYTITAPAGYRVSLTFIDFDLDPYQSDFLEIRDGTQASPVIGRYCNTSLPAPAVSSGNQMWIRFYSDWNFAGRGFRATFTAVCGWNTTDLNGTVLSPGFPGNYRNNQDCVYIITAPAGYQVTLTFTDFNLEASKNCSYDYMEIRDGYASSPTIGRYCSMSLPGPKRTSKNQMWIRFFSDWSITSGGFRATFHSVTECGWNTTALAGTVQSYNFPDNYPNNQDCVYTIMAPVGYHITLTFTDFILETCCDYVEIRDGNETSPVIGHYIYDGSLPGPANTSSSQMWIRFYSNGSVTRRGFRATFISECGWNTTALAGTVQSYNFPDNYPNNQDCVYTITAPVGYHITLTFTDFILETCCDYVEIRDGNETSPVIGHYIYDGSLPGPANTFSSQMWIRFYSDGSVTRRGFRATFISECGWNTTALAGTVQSYNFPDNYPNNQDCIYTITAPVGYHITLTFTDFILETCCDYVEIRDGNETSPVIGRYIYNGSLPGPADTSSSQMWIRFYSDGSVTRRGFRATFISECGWNTTALAGTVQSYNFPDNYPNNQDCVYTITAPVGYHITLTFTDFILETCCDYVEIRDGNETSPLIGRYIYNGSLPGPASTSGREMWIRFYSDGSVTMRGFRATFISAPGGPSMAAHERSLVQKTEVSELTAVMPATVVITSVTPQTSVPTTPAYTSTTSVTPQTSVPTTPAYTSTTSVTPQTSVPTTPANTSTVSATHGTSVTPGFSVVVTTSDTQPFDTNGGAEMTMTCDPDKAVDVVSHIWSVACTMERENVCIFKPRPAEDDGRNVICTITSSDGRSASGALQIELNYPPQEAPSIDGYSKDTVYQQGESLTLTCSVYGGKPLVTSVSFSCGTHQENSMDIIGTTYVQRVLPISSLTAEDEGMACLCTAKWKYADWYKLSDSAILRVKPRSIPHTKELDLPVIAGGIVGTVVIIFIIITVICLVVKRRMSLCVRPQKKMRDQPNENIFVVLGSSVQKLHLGDGQPSVTNPVYEDDLPDLEMKGNDTCNTQSEK
ncbi:cubilin-like isoform X2 [Babylonia areolata]|uniref:cubilin-like isoform X2 n=1 Tax=Babylonia areolata TaxID=304850 RepID=UPI003FD4CF53